MTGETLTYSACDFRPFLANGTDHLSAILYNWQFDKKGRGVILDNSYQETHSINVSRTHRNMNMHELNILNEGRTAIHIIHQPKFVDTVDLEEFGVTDEAGWVLDCGFREVEVDTGKILFEWYPHEHVNLSTSSVAITGLEGPPPSGWNFLYVFLSRYLLW
jgi:hypothetical protein